MRNLKFNRLSIAVIILLSVSCTKMDTGNLDHTKETKTSQSQKTDETKLFSNQIAVSDTDNNNRITVEVKSFSSSLLDQFQNTYKVVLLNCTSDNLYSYNNISRIQADTSSIISEEGIVIDILDTDFEETIKTFTVGLELKDPGFKALKSGATTVTWKGTTQQRSASLYHQPGSYYEHIGYKYGSTNCWICGWNWIPAPAGYYSWLYRSATSTICTDDDDIYKIGYQVNAENHSTYTYVVSFSSAGC